MKLWLRFKAWITASSRAERELDASLNRLEASIREVVEKDRPNAFRASGFRDYKLADDEWPDMVE